MLPARRPARLDLARRIPAKVAAITVAVIGTIGIVAVVGVAEVWILTTFVGGITGSVIAVWLAFCTSGSTLSAGLWAVGSLSNNYTQSVNGKKGFIICALGGVPAVWGAFAVITRSSLNRSGILRSGY
jgi:hypothetical protein